jgi:hypothetical protein
LFIIAPLMKAVYSKVDWQNTEEVNMVLQPNSK